MIEFVFEIPKNQSWHSRYKGYYILYIEALKEKYKFSSFDFEFYIKIILFFENTVDASLFKLLFYDEFSEYLERSFPYLRIENPSYEFQLAAIKDNGYRIMYIQNQTEELQIAAVKNTPAAIYHISNPIDKEHLEYLARYWKPQ
jgi:hypothetical protein